MTDTIADMLTRIRNALLAKKQDVAMPTSKLKVYIAEILKNEGYISSYSVVDSTRQLKIQLKYTSLGDPAIRNLQRVSKPGRRVYVTSQELPRVLNNLGIAIISTSQGLMTASQAKQSRVGGELMCYIY